MATINSFTIQGLSQLDVFSSALFGSNDHISNSPTSILSSNDKPLFTFRFPYFLFFCRRRDRDRDRERDRDRDRDRERDKSKERRDKDKKSRRSTSRTRNRSRSRSKNKKIVDHLEKERRKERLLRETEKKVQESPNTRVVAEIRNIENSTASSDKDECKLSSP